MNVIDRIKARVSIDDNGCHVFQGRAEIEAEVARLTGGE
jgi:hypothetical protein